MPLDLDFPDRICSEQASSLGCHPQDNMLLRLIPAVSEGDREPWGEVYNAPPALGGAQHFGALSSKEQK